MSGPRLLRARIASRLAAVHLAHPGLSLPDAVHRAVHDLADMQLPAVLPACPHEPADVDIGGLDARLHRIAIPT